MEGHLFATALEHPDAVPPFTALLVSGGHTLLLDVRGVGRLPPARRARATTRPARRSTRWPSCSAFPTPAVGTSSALARDGDGAPRSASRGRCCARNQQPGDADYYDVSFSGLKTAVLHAVRDAEARGALDDERARIARAFQDALVDTLVEKTDARRAAPTAARASCSAAAWPATARSPAAMRRAARRRAARSVFAPSPRLATDNAAMIARAGLFRFERGERADARRSTRYASLPLPGCGRDSVRARTRLAPPRHPLSSITHEPFAFDVGPLAAHRLRARGAARVRDRAGRLPARARAPRPRSRRRGDARHHLRRARSARSSARSSTTSSLTGDPGALFSRGGLRVLGRLHRGRCCSAGWSIRAQEALVPALRRRRGHRHRGRLRGRAHGLLGRRRRLRPAVERPARGDVPERRAAVAPRRTCATMFGIAVRRPARRRTTVIAVHPTQLYETAMGFVMFLVLWRLRDHEHAEGWLFGVYCVLAGVERFLVEFFRAKDDRFVGPLTSAQVIAMAIAAIGVLVMQLRKTPRARRARHPRRRGLTRGCPRAPTSTDSAAEHGPLVGRHVRLRAAVAGAPAGALCGRARSGPLAADAHAGPLGGRHAALRRDRARRGRARDRAPVRAGRGRRRSRRREHAARGNRVPEHRRVEIGWTWLAAPWQRTPINTEAKLLVLAARVRARSAVSRVRAQDRRAQPRSRGAPILRLGRRRRGHASATTWSPTAGGCATRCASASLADEWPAVSAGSRGAARGSAIVIRLASRSADRQSRTRLTGLRHRVRLTSARLRTVLNSRPVSWSRPRRVLRFLARRTRPSRDCRRCRSAAATDDASAPCPWHRSARAPVRWQLRHRARARCSSSSAAIRTPAASAPSASARARSVERGRRAARHAPRRARHPHRARTRADGRHHRPADRELTVPRSRARHGALTVRARRRGGRSRAVRALADGHPAGLAHRPSRRAPAPRRPRSAIRTPARRRSSTPSPGCGSGSATSPASPSSGSEGSFRAADGRRVSRARPARQLLAVRRLARRGHRPRGAASAAGATCRSPTSSCVVADAQHLERNLFLAEPGARARAARRRRAQPVRRGDARPASASTCPS